MDLHKDKDGFKEIIEASADSLKFERSHIEKDHWLSNILKTLSESSFKNQVYFKGGTSLSKGYHLIERFSEDLDLFVYTGNPDSSIQSEKNINKSVCKYILENNNHLKYDKSKSKLGGEYRKLHFSYGSSYKFAGLKEGLEVEIKSCSLKDKKHLYYPSDIKTIRPIVTIFLEQENRQDLIDKYGLNQFEINCINPRKTLCDKISRLAKFSYSENAEELIIRNIRDVYDLHALCDNKEYNGFLHSNDFIDAMQKVTEEDKLQKNSHAEKPRANAIIFKDAHKTMIQPQIAAAYNTDLSRLVFDRKKRPPLEAAIKTLEEIHQVLMSSHS